MFEKTGSGAIATVRRRAAISCARIAVRLPVVSDHPIFRCGPLHYSDSGDFAVMGVWPGSWLLQSETLSPSQLVTRTEELADCENSTVVDVSDLYEIFDVEGQSAHDIIASGCAVDFEIALAPMAVPTRLSHYDVVIVFRSLESFRILVPRSFADDLESWLDRAARYAFQPDLNGALS